MKCHKKLLRQHAIRVMLSVSYGTDPELKWFNLEVLSDSSAVEGPLVNVLYALICTDHTKLRL